MRTRFVFALVVPMLALGACSYSKNVPGHANGSEGQLVFAYGQQSQNLVGVPIGAERTILVGRDSGGSVACHGLGTGSVQGGGLTAQGEGGGLSAQGGHPEFPSDTCGTAPYQQVTLENVTCDDDACALTTEEKGTSVYVRLSSKRMTAVSTRLHVALKGKDGTVWRDSVPVRFAPAARIALEAKQADLAPMRFPIVEGISFLRAVGTVVDAEGEPMSVDDDAVIEQPVTGGVVEVDPTAYFHGTLIARHPGKSTIRWELPGVITRDVEVEVIARSELRTIEVHALPDDTERVDFDAFTLEKATPGAALTEVEVDDLAYFTARVRLADGRLALAPIDSIAVDPPTVLTPHMSTVAAWSFDLWHDTPRDAGAEVRTGTVTLEIATTSLTLPFTIASH